MKNNKGFTLVEVIVVVVILSILATMLIPRMTGFLTKSNDEKNYETAKDIMEFTQGYFYELYAENAHASNNKSIVMGIDNWQPDAIEKTLGESNNKVYISDIHNKKHYTKTTEILRNVGYKVKFDDSGEWKSDIPAGVMIIAGNYATYCNPLNSEYNPEKAYTVYGIIFNKNVGGDFFVMLKNGKKKYPSTKEELDKIIDDIEDENEIDPNKHLVKQIYVLKAGHPDSYNWADTWEYYHNRSHNGNEKVSYDANIGKESDW